MNTSALGVQHGEKLTVEIEVDTGSMNEHGYPVANYNVQKGLGHALKAMTTYQAMSVTLCLPGHVWVMLQQCGPGAEDVASKLLAESVELRRMWLAEVVEEKEIFAKLGGAE